MFKVIQRENGDWEWVIEIHSEGDRKPARSEEEAVEDIKDFLKRLGSHAFRNDYGGVEVKYTVIPYVEEQKQTQTAPPEQVTEKDPGTQADAAPTGAQDAAPKNPAAENTGENPVEENPPVDKVPDLPPLDNGGTKPGPGDGASGENIGTGPATSVD